MSTAVKTRIVKIGNSRGIRIPKIWLEQLGFSGEVVLSVESNKLVIKASRSPRQGWAEQFQAMAERQDDQPIVEFLPTNWDSEEWEWQ
ncbi:AbrB/MazE/SpoVT family DNA-binding domain-containing protein [Acidobacteriota bacterium]